MEKYGFVYCLMNESMPGLYKIGSTSKAPQNRADELSMATGVPNEFCVVCYIECANFRKIEKIFHEMLDEHRENNKREFFKVDLEKIVALFFYCYDGISWVDRIASENISLKPWQLENPFGAK
jgi:hypothetical protein